MKISIANKFLGITMLQEVFYMQWTWTTLDIASTSISVFQWENGDIAQ